MGGATGGTMDSELLMRLNTRLHTVENEGNSWQSLPSASSADAQRARQPPRPSARSKAVSVRQAAAMADGLAIPEYGPWDLLWRGARTWVVEARIDRYLDHAHHCALRHSCGHGAIHIRHARRSSLSWGRRALRLRGRRAPSRCGGARRLRAAALLRASWKLAKNRSVACDAVRVEFLHRSWPSRGVRYDRERGRTHRLHIGACGAFRVA